MVVVYNECMWVVEGFLWCCLVMVMCIVIMLLDLICELVYFVGDV